MRGNEGGVRGRIGSLARDLALESVVALFAAHMWRIQVIETQNIGMAVRGTNNLALRRQGRPLGTLAVRR